MFLGYPFGFSIDGDRGLELMQMTPSALIVAFTIWFSRRQSGHWRLAVTGRDEPVDDGSVRHRLHPASLRHLIAENASR